MNTLVKEAFISFFFKASVKATNFDFCVSAIEIKKTTQYSSEKGLITCERYRLDGAFEAFA